MTDVLLGKHFIANLKTLSKKYRQIATDIQPLIDQLRQGETPGDEIPNIGYTVFKVRVASSDMKRGKSGGYRVLYYVEVDTRVILFTVYAKSEAADLPAREIRRLLQEAIDEFRSE
jgi:mRNA-degrading endonuclease RelE of RelBE toxin-antitoxin system